MFSATCVDIWLKWQQVTHDQDAVKSYICISTTRIFSSQIRPCWNVLKYYNERRWNQPRLTWRRLTEGAFKWQQAVWRLGEGIRTQLKSPILVWTTIENYLMNILGPTIWINCFAFLGYISVKYYRPLGFWSALSFDCNMLKYSNHRWNLSVNQTSAGNSCVSVEEVMGQAMSRSENLNEMEANQQVDEQVGSRFRDAYARQVTECLVWYSDILPNTHIIISRVDDSTSSSSSISSMIHHDFIAKVKNPWSIFD